MKFVVGLLLGFSAYPLEFVAAILAGFFGLVLGAYLLFATYAFIGASRPRTRDWRSGFAIGLVAAMLLWIVKWDQNPTDIAIYSLTTTAAWPLGLLWSQWTWGHRAVAAVKNSIGNLIEAWRPTGY